MNNTPKIQIFVSQKTAVNRAVIMQAVSELISEGFGTRIEAEDLKLTGRKGALLVIDGNSEQLGYKKVRAVGIDPLFRLIVTDLGIDTDDSNTFDDDDLQLLKDGIRAECTILKGTAPRINCPCCGWKTM